MRIRTDDDVDDQGHEHRPKSFLARVCVRCCLLGKEWTYVSNRMSTADRYAFLARRSGALVVVACACLGVSSAAPSVIARHLAHAGSGDRCFVDVATDLAVVFVLILSAAPVYVAASVASALFCAGSPALWPGERRRAIQSASVPLRVAGAVILVFAAFGDLRALALFLSLGAAAFQAFWLGYYESDVRGVVDFDVCATLLRLAAT